jgi:hypothetical protein
MVISGRYTTFFIHELDSSSYAANSQFTRSSLRYFFTFCYLQLHFVIYATADAEPHQAEDVLFLVKPVSHYITTQFF